jgi:hypothetical protein
MKKKKGLRMALVSLVITASMYVVFYSRIDCKPTHAGFWFILALGMSIGVALTKFSEWYNSSHSNE